MTDTNARPDAPDPFTTQEIRSLIARLAPDERDGLLVELLSVQTHEERDDVLARLLAVVLNAHAADQRDALLRKFLQHYATLEWQPADDTEKPHEEDSHA